MSDFSVTHTPSDASGFIIVRTDTAPPSYFTVRIGRDHATPGGGWGSIPGHALRFARDQDAREFMKLYLPQQEPFCNVIPYGPK